MSTSDNSGADTTGAYRDGLNRWPVFDVEFVLESTDLGDDQCTFYPREAGEEEMLTTWITAADEDFVALDEIR